MFSWITNLFKNSHENSSETKTINKTPEQEAAEAIIFVKPITPERKAIALSCPFRSMFIPMERPPVFLYELGILTEKQKTELAEYIERDFGIIDTHTFFTAIEDFIVAEEIFELFQKFSKFQNTPIKENPTFRASMGLYMITSCIDLGLIAFDDYAELCEKYKEIIKKNNSSWKEFAENFEKEDFINNFLGKKILKREMKSLLNTENTTSPWQTLSWNDL